MLRLQDFNLLWLEFDIPDVLLHIYYHDVYNGYFDEVFYEVDRLLEALSKAFDLVIIVSDHGFRKTIKINLPLLLYALGFQDLTFKLSPTSNTASQYFALFLENLFNKGPRRIIRHLLWFRFLDLAFKYFLKLMKLEPHPYSKREISLLYPSRN